MIDILNPVFALVLLTFIFIGWMAQVRFAAMRRGEVRQADPGVRPSWIGQAGKVSNAYHNLLELPILFYVVVVCAILAKADDTIMVLLAWIFVAFRYAQALIHATYNRIVHRFLAFLGGVITLGTMWVRLFLHVSIV
jgi:hypothetical protein